jgi:GTPase SAR1 family protein
MTSSLFFGQIVIGPAGSGKSTYCRNLQDHGEVFKRTFLVVNLDPAAEAFNYRCDIDIRDLITVDDVKEEMALGPNGALVFCLEYLLENIDWLLDQLSDLNNDDYVLFDCPGQIELFSHLDVMTKIIYMLQRTGFALCSVYVIDSTFINEESKFISGILVTLATMMNLGLPHLSILSKCDLIMDKALLKKYLKHMDEVEPDPLEMPTSFSAKYIELSKSIKSIVDEYNMISLMPMDITKEDTIKDIIYQADMILQYEEYIGPDDKLYENLEKDNENMMDEER